MEDSVAQQSETDALSNLPFVPSSEARPYDFGVLVGDTFYLWDARLDVASRALRRLKDRLNTFITIVAALVTGVLFALFLASTFVLLPIEVWSSPDFLIEPSSSQLLFWLSVAGGLYLIYRRALARKEPREIVVAQGVDIASRQTTWETVHGNRSINTVHISSRCASDAWRGLDDAARLAEKFHHASIGLLHLFAGQLSQPSVGHVFARLGITFEQLKEPLLHALAEYPKATSGQPMAHVLDPLGQRTLLGAMMHATVEGRSVLRPVDVFVSAYRNSEFLRDLFYGLDVEEDAMENVLAWLRIREQLRARWQQYRRSSVFKPKGAMNRAMTAVATPLLDRVSTDLTRHASEGALPMLIGREEEMARVLRVFESGQRSVVLVGPPGVGKQAIVNGIAERMVREDVPELLRDRRLVSIDIARLVAGATPSQAQDRLLRALYEVGKSRNIVLCIPNIDDLVGISTGGTESLDLSGVLAQEIDKGYFVLMATATPGAYRNAVEASALAPVLTRVDIEEPGKNDAIRVVEANVSRAEAEHDIIFTYEAVEALVDLTGRYMHEQYLPEKAIQMMEEVALAAKQEHGAGSMVTEEDVAKVVSAAAKVPLTAVTQDERETLLNLEEKMHGRVIGQDDAVAMVSSALRRARTEMRSGRRPIANFLFLGPTGVGKTELAKTIAATYFGDESAMIRLDMSEYQDASSIHRLIGVPGSNQGGLLTESVRTRPFGLILLDELEKADAQILNVFLQVFDDGRLTDAAGRTIDFTQTIIVATSNAGSSYIQAEVKKGTPVEQMTTHLLEVELEQVYRPEFLNRFDGVVVFKPLTLENVKAIAGLMLKGVAARLEEKGIALRVSDEALHELSVAGYDPQFGARPMRRVIQERVEDKIATILLEGTVKRRDTIAVDVGGDVHVEAAVPV